LASPKLFFVNNIFFLSFLRKANQFFSDSKLFKIVTFIVLFIFTSDFCFGGVVSYLYELAQRELLRGNLYEAQQYFHKMLLLEPYNEKAIEGLKKLEAIKGKKFYGEEKEEGKKEERSQKVAQQFVPPPQVSLPEPPPAESVSLPEEKPVSINITAGGEEVSQEEKEEQLPISSPRTRIIDRILDRYEEEVVSRERVQSEREEKEEESAITVSEEGYRAKETREGKEAIARKIYNLTDISDVIDIEYKNSVLVRAVGLYRFLSTNEVFQLEKKEEFLEITAEEYGRGTIVVWTD